MTATEENKRNLHVSCKNPDCKFEIDWKECPSVEHAQNYYWIWNKIHSKDMQCIHNYVFEVIS